MEKYLGEPPWTPLQEVKEPEGLVSSATDARLNVTKTYLAQHASNEASQIPAFVSSKIQ